MGNNILISVIIPTFNRCDVLKMSLEHYQCQDLAFNLFEIIIIDDGSKDGTRTLVEQFIKVSGLNVHYYYQENQGPGVARNTGITNCCGDVVVVVNDDTIPEKDFLSRHLKFHEGHPENNCALLGFVTWAKELKITPFMRWLENGGPQFSYGKLKGTNVHWSQLWTCNVSFKKDFLMKNGLFDRDFIFAALEDVELGYRLDKHGLKLYYDNAVVGYHYHPTNLISVIDRMKKHGASVVIFSKKVGEASVLPPLGRPTYGKILDVLDRLFFCGPVENAMRNVAIWAEDKVSIPFIFDILLLHYRIVGRRDYLNNHAK